MLKDFNLPHLQCYHALDRPHPSLLEAGCGTAQITPNTSVLTGYSFKAEATRTGFPTAPSSRSGIRHKRILVSVSFDPGLKEISPALVLMMISDAHKN